MEHSEILSNLLLLLSASVIVVAIFRKLRLSPVLGYFAAGAAIGNYGLNIVTTSETSLWGEFGVVFLLFAIGLELTFERLKSMRSHVFGFGTLQVLISALFIGGGVYFLTTHITSPAIIIGGGLALSSTAIVLQVVAENRQQSTQVGRLSLAILLMQDFAVVPLLVLVPILAGDKSNLLIAMGTASLKALVALAGILIFGRLLLRPLFGMITSANAARSNELFVATTLLIALGAAWATERMGLSLALGAFVAGLLVAETEFQLQAEESISPFKGLLLGLFFMTVGMSINTHLIIEKLWLIVILSLSLIFIKAAIIFGLCLLFRFTVSTAIHAGLLLSQGSEFAFILFNLAMEKQVISQEVGQILLLVVTITMALTPLLSIIGNKLAALIDKGDKVAQKEAGRELGDVENHVIIIGFGRVGKMVARVLAAENVHYAAIDINSENVAEGQKESFPVYTGDGSNIAFLQSIGIERAKSIIITVDNEITLKKAAKTISHNFPEIPIIVRAKDLSDSVNIYQAGATVIVPETYETGLQLGGAVLKSVGISELEVSRIKNQFRAGSYVLIKNPDEEEEEGDDELGYDYMGQHIINDFSFNNTKPNNKT